MKICYICHVTKRSSTKILVGSLLLLMCIGNNCRPQVVLSWLYKPILYLDFSTGKTDSYHHYWKYSFWIAMIQSHFDYACSAWYPILIKKLKNKLQTSQSNCTGFRLHLNRSIYIAIKELAINWNWGNNIMKECNILLYAWFATSKTGWFLV